MCVELLDPQTLSSHMENFEIWVPTPEGQKEKDSTDNNMIKTMFTGVALFFYKIGMMQKLLWPLHRVNFQICEMFHFKKKKKSNVIKAHIFLYVVPE